MSSLPIVPHQICQLSSRDLEVAEQTAGQLLARYPQLRIEPILAALVPESIEAAPQLHVDDLTEIQRASSGIVFYQERARLRACDGDFLATSMPATEGFESYCEDLGLGAVNWIQPDCRGHLLRLAEACWQDRAVRRDLVRQVRQHGMRYIHPHMGTRAVWELALLLSQASHSTVKVISPPPTVTRFANDKGAFAALVDLMFGSEETPANAVTWNTATTSKRLLELAESPVRMVAIKLPSCAGGEGNLLMPMAELRGRSLHEIDAILHERLPELKYECGDELLVTQWLDHVVAAPSAQCWIPPGRSDLPQLEGIFAQMTEGERGFFSGFYPIELPRRLEQKITRRCLQLARVYQLLGYIGRCSFDMLLIGSELDSAALKFIECNGRWGGTSLPMTLVNRLWGDWQAQPFSSRILHLDGAQQINFAELLSTLVDQLYQLPTGSGQYLLYNPQRMRIRGDVSIIALHDNWETAYASIGNGPFTLCADRLRDVISQRNANSVG